MILYALFKLLLFLITIIANILNGIPGINTINQSIEPYIQAISNLIMGGLELISFFLPMNLIKIIIPIIITIELILYNLDIIKFGIKKIFAR